MKKAIIRIVSLMLVLTTLLSYGVVSYAASSVSSVSCGSTARDGKKTTFYVKVPANKSGSIKFTMGCGKLAPASYNSTVGGEDETYSVHASYEIKVYRYVSGSWKLEQDFDAYCASSKSVSFKKYSSAQKYKIEVWSWKTLTMVNSYIKNFPASTLGFYASMVSSPYWAKMPTCVAKNSSNCTLYTSCP